MNATLSCAKPFWRKVALPAAAVVAIELYLQPAEGAGTQLLRTGGLSSSSFCQCLPIVSMEAHGLSNSATLLGMVSLLDKGEMSSVALLS